MGAVDEGHISPVEAGSGMVKNFTYLSFNMSSECEATFEVKCWISKALKGFGALRTPIVSYLLLRRGQLIMLWSFPCCCMVLKHGHQRPLMCVC